MSATAKTAIAATLRAALGSGSSEVIGVFLVAVTVFTGRIGSVAFHPDESHWIASSSAFEAFVTGDLGAPQWQESYWTLTQPPMTRYLIGLGRVAGGYGVGDLNRRWHFELDRLRNIADGAMPTPGLLWYSRLPMAILASMSCVLGFVVLTALAGRVAGYAWALLFLVSPYLSQTLGRAMSEAPLLAAVLGVTLLAWRTIVRTELTADQPSLGRPVGLLLLSAVGCGIAAAIKLNGFLTLAVLLPLTAYVGMRLSRRAEVKPRWSLWGALAAAELAFLTFVAVNPYLYPAPMQRAWRMVAHRQAEMLGQQQLYPEAIMPAGAEHVRRIGTRLLSDYAPLTGGVSPLLYAVLGLLGVSVTIQIAFDGRASLRRRAAAVALVTTAAASSAPTLIMPIDWDRYYLFPEVFAIAFAAVGIARISALLRRICAEARRGTLATEAGDRSDGVL